MILSGYNLQFGFKQQYSQAAVPPALINIITENVREPLHDGNIGCGVFVEIQKAFDTVDHQILLVKLNHYGIRVVSNDQFKSYLSNRNPCIHKWIWIRSRCYKLWHSCRICSRTPSVFVHVNDLNQAITFCKAHHFADDTNLLCLSNSIKKLNGLVNSDLNHLVNWLNANKGSLSVKKDWNSNIKNITQKNRKTMGLLRRFQPILPRSSLLTIYKTFIRSQLDFADVIYDQACNSSFHEKLESIQYNACLAITGAIRKTSSEKLYQC